jgi:hypothetical protein
MRQVGYRLSLTARCGFEHRKRGPWVRVTAIRGPAVAMDNPPLREDHRAKDDAGSPQPGLPLERDNDLEPTLL